MQAAGAFTLFFAGALSFFGCLISLITRSKKEWHKLYWLFVIILLTVLVTTIIFLFNTDTIQLNKSKIETKSESNIEIEIDASIQESLNRIGNVENQDKPVQSNQQDSSSNDNPNTVNE